MVIIMTENEKTGNVWIMNYRILIIAGIVLLCLLPAGAQAATATSTIDAKIDKYIAVSITDAYTGTWNLNNVGATNTQDYGDLVISSNWGWALTTAATNGDYLKSTTTPTVLANKLKLNGVDVTMFVDSRPGSGTKTDDLSFSQFVSFSDPPDLYGTVVTFTVTSA